MLDHHCISFLFIESLFKNVLVSFFKKKKKSYGLVEPRNILYSNEEAMNKFECRNNGHF
jgi:hypothetical protein